MAESELENAVIPEECNFCTNHENDYDIMGIGCCEECAEKYAIDPTEFEKKIMKAF